MRRRREPLDHPWLLVGILGLYAASIPWWAGEGTPELVLGMPAWAALSLGATLGVSCLTAFAVLRLWEDDDDDQDVEGDAG